MNSIVGDYQQNTQKIIKYIKQACNNHADIILFPEMCVNGYPPEDLLLKTQFLNDSLKSIKDVKDFTVDKDIVIILGAVECDEYYNIYNSAQIIFKGNLLGNYKKRLLSSFSFFDERRYFNPSDILTLIELNGSKIGITIGNEICFPNSSLYSAVNNEIDLILNLSASVFYKNKINSIYNILKARALELSSWVVYCNMVGSQDELVFDGGSMVIDPYGVIEMNAPLFEEGIYFIDIDAEEAKRAKLKNSKSSSLYQVKNSVEIININKIVSKKRKIKSITSKIPDENELLYSAIKLGLRDYLVKNGFSSVVLGLSGGVDSALVASIAADSIGSKNVLALIMPSEFTSKKSVEDAVELSLNLGIKYKIISISELYNTYLDTLKESFKGKTFDETEENLQARIRGNIIMAFSNKFGHLALVCGNKSEVATGYSTLYGDTAGGFAPIKDLYKTELYKVAKKYNEIHNKEIITKSILEKPPSAELRPNQKDEDKLPPYDILDKILFNYIERGKSYNELLEMGLNEEIVKNVINMVEKSEWKRRQLPAGIKLSELSFGKERKMPITNKYRFW
jgi:NAD+ synthase (glutamine-hydrolysing)